MSETTPGGDITRIVNSYVVEKCRKNELRHTNKTANVFYKKMLGVVYKMDAKIFYFTLRSYNIF